MVVSERSGPLPVLGAGCGLEWMEGVFSMWVQTSKYIPFLYHHNGWKNIPQLTGFSPFFIIFG